MKKFLLILLFLPIFCNSQNVWFNSYPTAVATLPSVITIDPYNTDLWCGVRAYGEVVNNGGTSILEYGFYWSYSGDPYPNGTKYQTSTVVGNTFNGQILCGDQANINIRAYIRNSVGEVQGDIVSTSTRSIPTLSLNSSNITQTTADINFSNPISGSAHLRSVYWGISSIYENHTSVIQNSDATVTWNLTGLTANTTYKYAGYYENEFCNTTSSEYTFTTAGACNVPTLTTTTASNVTNSTALSGGNISSDGGCSVFERGVCWNTSGNPTTSNSKTSDGSGIGSYTSSITGLNCGITYYAKAYATNTQGTAYGNQISFTTTTSNPSIQTLSASNITTNSFTLSADPISAGCPAYTTYSGIEWDINSNFTNSCAINSPTPTTLDQFSVNVEYSPTCGDITPNTTYYWRGFIISNSIYYYGETKTVTTLPNCSSSPTVGTFYEGYNAETTQITTWYTITSDGGCSLTGSGLCYSTTNSNPTLSDSHISGNFESKSGSTYYYNGTITGLSSGTTYYVRAYATNSNGTSYGTTETMVTQ